MQLMRALVCCLVLLGATSASASPVIKEWGLSPDDVVAKLKALGHEVDFQGCPVPWSVRDHQVLVTATMKGSGGGHSVRYVFDERGLGGVLEGSIRQQSVCDQWEADLTAKYGTPEQLGSSDVIWRTTDGAESVRLMRAGKDACERWTTPKAFADDKYAVKGTKQDCFDPLKLGERQRGELSQSDSCTSTTDIYFDMRPLRIETESDLYFDLSIDKAGSIELARFNGETLAKADAKKGVYHEAGFRQKLTPGCYLVQIAAKEPKTRTEYRLQLHPYAGWKANDDLEREEQLGEEPDEGPPTAQYSALVLGGRSQYYGGTTHINVAVAMASLDAGNMYGMNTQIGFEVTKHPRVRGIVGGSVGVMYQRLDDMWSTTNTMFPVSLWGGVRANALPKLLVQARLGVLGYYISADADEDMIGAYDRSETGSGYVFGLDMAYGPLVLGLEQMFLATGVTTFRLGFGF